MRRVKVLITGGAGFIGSTVASACADNGITPIILDNLSTGRAAYTAGREFYQGDIADGPLVDRIFRDNPDISAVIHCAAMSVVHESVSQPFRYYQENVVKSIDFIGHMLRNRCLTLVFSSSASIYGIGPRHRAAAALPSVGSFAVDEDSPVAPASPYAHSKHMVEQITADISAATAMRVLVLRYFNPIGADPQLRTGLPPRRGDTILGAMIEASRGSEPFAINGTDYPTRDGTAVRDYVHVWDVATAHANAVHRLPVLFAGDTRRLVINLGSGSGTTVRELVQVFNDVTGRPLRVVEAPRRPGDLPGIYSHYERARELLGWSPVRSLAESVQDSLSWAARCSAAAES